MQQEMCRVRLDEIRGARCTTAPDRSARSRRSSTTSRRACREHVEIDADDEVEVTDEQQGKGG